MSYVVLARKYRPRRFSEMVGQEHVVQALSNALRQQRLHHAYLFTGTRGIGKTTVSRILAKSLNCTGVDGSGGITAEPCGVCSACTEIDADRYLDYIEMDAASNRGIGEIQDLIERAAYKPGVGRFKVFMIDEAHQLTKDAFNALLKTLEEPPEYLKFVLATTDPEKMLPTVLSRCLQFNLRPMAPATVREHLKRVLADEGIPCDEASLRLLGRAARGSMRDGLSLADQAIAYGAGRLDEALVRAMLGSVDRGQARELIEALSRRDGAAVLATVDALRQLGLACSGTLEEVAMLLQQMAVEQAVPGALDAHDPDTDDARALAPQLGADETQLLYSIVLHGREELSLMSDEYGALTMVLLRFLAFPAAGVSAPAREARAAPLRATAAPSLSLAAARPRPVGPALAERTGASPGAAPRPSSTPPVPGGVQSAQARPTSATPTLGDPLPAPPPPPPLPDADAPLTVLSPAHPTPAAMLALGERWYGLVQRLSAQGALAALTRELAAQGGLRGIDDATQPPTWTLTVERETLRTPALRDKLAAALSAELGVALQLELEAGVPVDSPARREAAERQSRQADAEALIQDDPVVKALLEQYKSARIVPGSIKPV